MAMNNSHSNKFSSFIKSRQFVALFALLTLAFSGLWMAHTQMNRIPDLWEHIYRVSGIVNGDIVARPVQSVSSYHTNSAENYGGKVDWDWIYLSNDHIDPFDSGPVHLDSITHSDSSGADVPYNNTGVYSPISYLPQIAGFALGKSLNLTASTTYYLTEVIMLLVYTALTTWAIAKLPRYRLPMTLLLFSPPVIYHFSFAISADSLTQALIIVFSCLLFSAYTKKPQTKEYIVLGIVGATLALTKFAYTPLALAPLALLVVHSPTARQAKIAVLGTVVLASVSVFSWLKIIGGMVSNPSSVSEAEVHTRMQSLFQDPSVAAKAIWYSFSHLQGAFRSPLILALIWSGFILVLFIIIANTVVAPTNGRESLYWITAYSMIIGTLLATYLAMWLQGTPSTMYGVYTMQLRYFVPLLPLLLLCFLENWGQLTDKIRQSTQRITKTE
jgi:uncharacterized membrane protein